MKEIFPKLITFGLSFLMFGLAILQIFLGYTLSGKRGHQQKVFMDDEPTKFWTIVSIWIIVGAIVLVVGVISIFRKGKSL
ncbi:MAG TPA: hypothetical protein PKY82_00890 [Pyrinomonadaceae bacterium]|nr:hypothetical protein [Pyrinomonadaceae bacterium]